MKATSIRQPRRRRALAATFAATVAASLAVALNPVTAAAVDQTLKNGCHSPESYSGELISPVFEVTGGTPMVSFQGWFEAESVSPTGHDLATVLYSVDGGPTTEIGQLITTALPNSGGDADIGYSNNGTGEAPTFEPYTFALPETAGTTGVRVHFRFDSLDSIYNGFRGFAVDGVTLPAVGGLVEGFEGAAPNWVFDPVSGPGGPFWHMVANSQLISIKSPEINPDLVTLDPADTGALPLAFAGTRVAWFGGDTSGTFCGPDFGNRFVFDNQPPETTITGAPSGPTSSTAASLTFTSSEPGSSFQCKLDGATFEPCSSPHALSGLSQAVHNFEVQATDPSGNTDPTPAAHAWMVVKPLPRTLADLTKPTIGEDVNVQAKSGVVLVGVRTGAASAGGAGARASQKGITFVPLAEARQIPVGSLLDTSKGVVTLQSARNTSGVTQNGNFGKGIFQVLQARKSKGLTELALKGSSFKSCKPAKKRGKRRGRRSGVHAVGSAGRTIRRLSGNANGRFRTRGRRSAATVRGTIWDVTDRCDGTLTKVKRGKVAVRDFRLKKTIVLKSGKSYLAR